jgi:putative transposon-encoded protein
MEPGTDITENMKTTGTEASPQIGMKVKLEVYGEEMIEKIVKQSGNSGRVYLPPNWVGCRVKIIKLGRDEEQEL